MRIKIVESVDWYDRTVSQDLYIDGERELSVYPLTDCPEDAIIGRSLVSCKTIANLMQRAYEAGDDMEEFIVEIVEEE
jgi:hypothetical protein